MQAMVCVLCDGVRLQPVSDRDCRTGESLIVAQCDGCGLVQQTPMPDAHALQRWYAERYRADYKGVREPAPRHVLRAGRIALERLASLQAAGVVRGRLLDVGAGGGEFVHLARQAGFDASGVELDHGYREFANREYGTRIAAGGLDDAQGRHDVVTIFHVFEHLPSPLAAMARLHALLVPGGRLFVEVPWVEAADASPRNLFFRAHVTYFSAPTLLACASRWFEPVAIDTHGGLKMLLRARLTPLAAPALPDAAAVRAMRAAVARIGWARYVVVGRAWRKPFAKL
ncbi:MAG: class I SAM-dependent methyltransferase, partial [Burkholderiales bacterium]|nr:class I SAM-dependent methyltransferase [Burkholderiales bacterium]